MTDYYIIYQVTNNINGKIYIGSHKTKDIDDGYMGSGKYLSRAIKKHGLENFTKEILFVFDNPEDMYDKEAELVDDDFLTETNTYNLKRGGFGGFDYINSIGINNSNKDMKSVGKKISNKMKGRKLPQHIIYKVKESYQLGTRKPSGCTSPQGLQEVRKKTWTSSARKKREETRREINFQQGENNSQYGTMWIVNEHLQENRKIHFGGEIPEGWRKGYIINFDNFFKKQARENERKHNLLIEKENRIDRLKEIMYYYRDNDISMRELTKKFNVGQNIYMSFERYFKDEYYEIVKNKPRNSNVSKKRYE